MRPGLFAPANDPTNVVVVDGRGWVINGDYQMDVHEDDTVSFRREKPLVRVADLGHFASSDYQELIREYDAGLLPKPNTVPWPVPKDCACAGCEKRRRTTTRERAQFDADDSIPF